jgi:hypothetical protein
MITHAGVRQLQLQLRCIIHRGANTPSDTPIALLHASKPQPLGASDAPSASTRPRGCYPRMSFTSNWPAWPRSFSLLNLAACCA